MKGRKAILGGGFTLLVLGVLMGVQVWGLSRIGGPMGPAASGGTPQPSQIPMPTGNPARGVRATLPPVEALRWIQPPQAQGAKILYAGAKSEREGGYYLLDPETGEEIRLEPFPPDQGGGAPGATMRVSPTGERILYTLFNNMDPPKHLGIGSVWTMNPDGSDKRMLVGSDERSYPANAIWSPEGKRIAYLRYADPRAAVEGRADPDQVELWVMNADGSGQRRVAGLPAVEDVYGTNNSFQWLLDDHIYIVTRITSEGEWLRVNPDTGEVVRLVEGVQPWEVVISPDTRWIWVTGGMTEERIVALGRWPLRLPGVPAWDRRGERVAFIQRAYPYGEQTGREAGLWVWDLSSGREVRLTALDGETAARCGRLEWSPDGRMLLCAAIEGLYVIWVERDVARMVVANPWAKEQLAGVAFIGWVPVVR